MATTYWAVKHKKTGKWWNRMRRVWQEKRSFNCQYTGDPTGAFKLPKDGVPKCITVFDAAETRQRAEARGEMRALENLRHGYAISDAALVSELDALIADAKRRAGQGPRSGIAAIIGKWPGDESDEEIAELLAQLS